MARLLHEGYVEMENAILWDRHIRLAADPFRNSPKGTYSQISRWISETGFNNDSKLLDVCCGQGVTSDLASKVSGSKVTGVDLSSPLISLSMQYSYNNPRLDFRVGNAADLKGLKNDEFDGAMMINGIFHLPTPDMFSSLCELSRVSKGPILITNVNPPAYEFFASAFQKPTRTSETHLELDPVTIVEGNPEISGPGSERIVLTNTPFVMHPNTNLLAAIDNAGLRVTNTETFGPVSMVGGPEGLDLFVKIELAHKEMKVY